jgi:protein tyrosine/serine phosphatase
MDVDKLIDDFIKKNDINIEEYEKLQEKIEEKESMFSEEEIYKFDFMEEFREEYLKHKDHEIKGIRKEEISENGNREFLSFVVCKDCKIILDTAHVLMKPIKK